jgi:hypothetical protein
MEQEWQVWTTWVRTRIDHARRSQSGFTSIEWLFVAIGVIAIATIAVAAVKTYVTKETGQLGKP